MFQYLSSFLLQKVGHLIQKYYIKFATVLTTFGGIPIYKLIIVSLSLEIML